MVIVKWSAYLPSTLAFRVHIRLKSKADVDAF